MLKVTGLSCSMAEQIEFHMNAGDFYVLFGPDDSGKTEIINAIMGVSKRYAGSVLYEGKEIKKLSMKERKTIRYVPDEILMLYGVKVKKYLKTMAKTYGVKDKEFITWLVDYFEIDTKEYLTEMTYEGNKLVSIIGALLTSPKLLILDEPFNFLTEEMSEKLLSYLKKKNEEGMSILLLSEHFEDADENANAYVYIKEGELIKEDCVPNGWIPPKKIEFRKVDVDKMKGLFGEPDSVHREEYTYLSELSWEEIGEKVTACGMEKHVVVQSARMGEILDIRCKKEEKQEQENEIEEVITEQQVASTIEEDMTTKEEGKEKEE